MALRSFVLQLLVTLLTVRAVTVYNQEPIAHVQTLSAQSVAATASGTSAAPLASHTGYKAYDPMTLTPPELPDPRPATQFNVQLQNSASNVQGLSIFQSGAFFGFSIETSVINQVREYLCLIYDTYTLSSSQCSSCSRQEFVRLPPCLSRLPLTPPLQSSHIQVPFLNLISLVAQRAGRFHIRIGGNTQETARYVDSTPDGRMIEKQGVDPNNPVSWFPHSRSPT